MMIMEREVLECWSTHDVKSWAAHALGAEIAELFEKEEITGECLSEISVEELKEMGVKKMGKRLLVIKKLKALIGHGQSGQSDSGVEGESYSSPDSSPKPPSPPRSTSHSPDMMEGLREEVTLPCPMETNTATILSGSTSDPLSSSPLQVTPPTMASTSPKPVITPNILLHTSPLKSTSPSLLGAASPLPSTTSPIQPVIPTPLNPTSPSPNTLIRAPIAHIPSHVDLYHVPKRMRLSPPAFSPTMLNSTLNPAVSPLEEALSKLNSYSDMARALSQHSLASSVRSLLGVTSSLADDHQKILPGQVLKPIPHISSVTSCYRDNEVVTSPVDHVTSRDKSLSPVSTGQSLSDMMLDMKPSMINNSIFSKVRGSSTTSEGDKLDHHSPPTISVGDAVFQVNCRGKLTRESQERLKQVNPRLHSHYLTKRNLIKRACRTVFRDPPPFFYTDADRNSQEDLQVLEQLTDKLSPVCQIPELCFGIQGIRNHIIDSCRERRRECKRQSYRPSKARPAGHLYNSDGTHITDGEGHEVKDDTNDLPYTLSQDSADCIIRILFNVESVYHVRRSVHLIPITKKLGLSQRVDKNWMIMAVAQALLNNRYITFKQGADLDHLTPNDFYLEVPDELLTSAQDIDVN